MDNQSWSSKCFSKQICFSLFSRQTRGENNLEVIWEIKRSSLCSQPQKNIFITYVGLCPYWWGYVCPFHAWGVANFYFFFRMGWVGIRWGVKHPRRGFLFSWHGVWAGVENGGREFSWLGMEWGTVKFPFLLLQIHIFGKLHQTLKDTKLVRIGKYHFFTAN